MRITSGMFSPFCVCVVLYVKEASLMEALAYCTVVVIASARSYYQGRRRRRWPFCCCTHWRNILIRKEEPRGIWKKENEKNVVYNSSSSSISERRGRLEWRPSAINRANLSLQTKCNMHRHHHHHRRHSFTQRKVGRRERERDQMDVAYILSMCVCGRDESKETFEKDTHQRV